MDTLQQKELLFEENEKSKAVAYLLWLFFGAFSAHRFYAGQTKSAVVRLIMLIIPVIGWSILALLWLIDLFLIPGMINERNLKTIDMIYGPEKPVEVQKEAPKAVANEVDKRRQAMLDDLKKTGYRKERRDDITRIYR
ncbi:hypothetical protein EH31_08065 [Erythrobacter longus]|uniref:TM2 domain-containing protein n=1 Tax=Erythrobacter longus TaxID=1044 RepID=A0A074MDX5_ERYLO|nr:TM2 domain-containing protein [Erythrobacter longus]KEO90980.1 hypothetical protein EH31_08065 [Erythrobacter longus]